jgi:type IV pilus assembly protein PilM
MIPQGLKQQWTELLERLQQFRDIFRTAQDVVFTDLVGIDIDDTWMLAIQLRNPLGIVHVVGSSMDQLPSGVITDDNVADRVALSTNISHLLQGHFRSKNAALAAVGSKVAIKQVKLDGPLSEQDAETRAWHEARKAFPDLVKSILLDFTQETEMGPNKAKQYTLIIVIVRREDVAPRIEAVQKAGLTTKVLDVDYFALERAYQLFAPQLPKQHVEKFVAIIHFNPHNITLVVMNRKKAIYYVRQNYVGHTLIPFIERAISGEKLSTASKTEIPVFTLQPANQMPTLGELAAEPAEVVDANQLSNEQKSHAVMSIRRLFQSFYGEQPGRVIDSVAMTGRCALLPELVQYVGKTLDMPIIAANPLASFKTSDDPAAKRMQALGPAFAVACGLAIRGVPLWK